MGKRYGRGHVRGRPPNDEAVLGVEARAFAEAVGARLVEARKAIGMSQATLAEQVRKTQEWASRVEHGQIRVTLEDALYLAHAVGVRLDALVYDRPVGEHKPGL